MDNAQKAIMIGVGLFITIIIIAAVMLITGMGQNLLNKGQTQVSGISESLENDLIQQYDGKTFSGNQVRTAAVQLISRNESGLEVVIKNAKSDVVVENDTVLSNGTKLKKNTFKSGDATIDEINNKLSGKDQKSYTGEVSLTDKGVLRVTFYKN